MLHRDSALRHVGERLISHLLNVRILDVVLLPSLRFDGSLEIPLVNVKVVDAQITVDELVWVGEHANNGSGDGIVCRGIERWLAILVDPYLFVAHVDTQAGVLQAHVKEISNRDESVADLILFLLEEAENIHSRAKEVLLRSRWAGNIRAE